jgi:RHH-type proline utilization regulon transcriptional repressor/proline dehydrogenase/delta 1-pyrroline-5-carboxylate dehydrogenase
MSDPAVGSWSDRDLPGASETVDLVRRWLERSGSGSQRSESQRWFPADGPAGVEVLLRFADQVLRPQDLRVAARGLERLSRGVPRSLPRALRIGLALGGGPAVLLPWPTIPIARRLFRRLTAHVILDATPARLDRSLAALRRPGVRIDLVPLGPSVLSEREAERRMGVLADLLARHDVDRVTVRVPSVTGPSSGWDHEAAVARAADRVARLLEATAGSRSTALLTLAPEGARDLDIAVAVVTRVLAQPRFARVEAGIALPVVLPGALDALEEVSAWARRRVAEGGAGITVRIDAGARLPRERADATVRGRAPAVWPTRREVDAAYLRMLDRALTPANTDAMRVVVAGADLVDLAVARLLAARRGVTSRLAIEVPLGHAPTLVDALRSGAGEVLVSAPVASGEEFGAAVGELLAREADPEHGTLPFAGPDARPVKLDDRAVRLREAFAAAADGVVVPDRRANRRARELPTAAAPFRNEPDTDPSLAANREWAAAIVARAASRDAVRSASSPRVRDAAGLRARVEAAAAAGRAWRRVAPAERAELFRRTGEVLAILRARIIEVIVAESGLTFADADADVSAAVDLANYTAERVGALDSIHGAVVEPGTLTAVVPWGRSLVAGCLGDVLAALAAGSAVIFAPAPGGVLAAAAVIEALREAGFPSDVVELVDLPDDGRRALPLQPDVDRAFVTGSREAAEFVRSRRPDLPLHGEAEGRNTVVVTPTADADRAVADLVESAFRAAGQLPSAVSLAILVGSAAGSEIFRDRLVDAVTSVRVGPPTEIGARIGPLLRAPDEGLDRALTRLCEGESWLVRPRQLDATDLLWSPGVRVVDPAGDLEGGYVGPVLDVVAVETLDEAIAMQNAVGGGSVAGLHALDPAEIASWLARVEAGDLFVNRATTTGPARLRPAGGGRTALGPGAKSGGPNALIALGSWHPVPQEPGGDLRLDGLDEAVRAVIEACQGGLDYPGFDRVRRGALSDEAAWGAEFGLSHDPAALGVERNVLRYRPAEVSVRLAESGASDDLIRVIAAGVRARALLRVSSAVPLPGGLLRLVADGTVRIADAVLESDREWEARVARERPSRVRLVGAAGASPRSAVWSAAGSVWSGPVTSAGRIELLPFLREQTVTVTAHRFGIPDRGIAALPI